MQLEDFYLQPSVVPAKDSLAFWENNKQEILRHQKNFRIKYPPFFKAKRLFFLAQCHLVKKFVIGQMSAGIGDMVLYSHLPRLLKEAYPKYGVFVYESEIAKIVFAYNPYVDGFTADKSGLWKKKGSGCDLGSGHFSQMKAVFFGIGKCLPQGEVFIGPKETAVVHQSSKPVATVQAHGKTIASPASDEIWSAIVQEMRQRYHVVQLKSPQEIVINGVDQTVTGIRECIVQQSAAQLHVGLDSGFMHTAAALKVPSIVILDKIAANMPFLENGIHQLVLPQLKGQRINFLYPQNVHLCVGASTAKTPALTQETLRMAMDGQVYPFGREKIV